MLFSKYHNQHLGLSPAVWPWADHLSCVAHTHCVDSGLKKFLSSTLFLFCFFTLLPSMRRKAQIYLAYLSAIQVSALFMYSQGRESLPEGKWLTNVCSILHSVLLFIGEASSDFGPKLDFSGKCLKLGLLNPSCTVFH